MDTDPGNMGMTPSTCVVPGTRQYFPETFDQIVKSTIPPGNQQASTLSFTRDNGAIDEMISRLLEAVGGIDHPDLIRQMILASVKAGQENTQRADLKLMLSTLKEMRFTSKVFGPYRHVKKVSVFGSARVHRNSITCDMARLLGEELAHIGFMVITGGGEGIMMAANEGAGHEHSFGMCIRLPFERQPNQVVEGSPRSIIYKYFFNRKVAFIKEANAVVVFPGGFGTLDETIETLTLLQTGKRTPIPLVLMDEPEGTYWSRWISFMKVELASKGYICDRDFALFDRADSVHQAVQIIRGFYRRYHSMRFVGERLVIRMHSPLSLQKIARLRREFQDLLLPGGQMSVMGLLPEESDEKDSARLTRLVLDFNRREFSRLKQLIDCINAA